MKKNSVFFINAHPDDLIGSAGVAFLLQRQKRFALHVLDLTHGEFGLTEQGVASTECANIRTAEEKRACAMLGIHPQFLEETDGNSFVTPECCARVAALFRESPPRAIFTHWPVDRHPDHIICYAIVIKALQIAGLEAEIYFFEESIQTIAMPIMHYVPIDEDIMERKVELIRQYVCQNQHDNMAQRKICEARYHGWKAGVTFAECFGSFQVPLPGKNSILNEIDGDNCKPIF